MNMWAAPGLPYSATTIYQTLDWSIDFRSMLTRLGVFEALLLGN